MESPSARESSDLHDWRSHPEFTVKKARDKLELMWCADVRRKRNEGWKFPKEITAKMKELTKGGTVLHLFGGKADFGVRMDIDPIVKPDIIGDAWLPPFPENSFDTVIMDPPYFSVNAQVRISLFVNAAFIARKQVIWLHTLWVSPAVGLTLDRAWLIRVGDSCTVRCMQLFKRTSRKVRPKMHHPRGAGMKYNRWLAQPQGLPFGEHKNEKGND